MTSLSLYWLAMNLVAREPLVVELVKPRALSAVGIVLDIPATRSERAILISVGHHESRFLSYAIDGTGACGETQIQQPELWGSSRTAIFADRHEAYRVSLKILRYSRQACPGTWARVLTAYVSGKCGVAPLKAREICEPTGLCDLKYVLEEAA